MSGMMKTGGALLVEALDGMLEQTTFEARARELHALISPFVIGENGERKSHTTLSSPAAFETGLEALIAHAASRQEVVRSALSQQE